MELDSAVEVLHSSVIWSICEPIDDKETFYFLDFVDYKPMSLDAKKTSHSSQISVIFCQMFGSSYFQWKSKVDRV